MGISEYEDYLKNCSLDDSFSPFADQIQLIDRIDKKDVSQQYMIHGQYYTGIVYTFYDTEGYGFIKSYGDLENARSYSQGFEVYFKVQMQ